jgi:hypothetical protein
MEAKKLVKLKASIHLIITFILKKNNNKKKKRKKEKTLSFHALTFFFLSIATHSEVFMLHSFYKEQGRLVISYYKGNKANYYSEKETKTRAKKEKRLQACHGFQNQFGKAKKRPAPPPLLDFKSYTKLRTSIHGSIY